MQVWRDLAEVPDGFGPSVVTIGNFDGVHRGHVDVLRRMVADAAAPGARAVAVTFSTTMNAGSLTGQTSAGPCTGTIQVSADDFATCVPFTSSSVTLSNGDKTASLTPATGLLVNTTYKVRVTTAAQSTDGLSLAAPYTSTTGFTIAAPSVLCDGSLVISQVFGGGNNSGGTFKSDYVELHNRGTTAISLSGKSIQYASSSGSNWSVAVRRM